MTKDELRAAHHQAGADLSNATLNLRLAAESGDDGALLEAGREYRLARERFAKTFADWTGM